MNQKHNRFRANMSKEQMDQLQATEIKSKRTRHGKVFALGANRFQAVTYTDPVHRFNPATQEWDEIDNRFTETECMKNARESWKQGKMPRIAVNDPLLTCETGAMTTTCGVSGENPFIRIRNEQANVLSWGIEGATSILPEIEQDEDAVAEEAAAAQAEQRPTVRSLREKVLNHLQGNAIYRDIFPGVDLRCKLGHSFKDELIFEAPECVRNVTFLLSAPGCTMQMNEGNVVLIENANGETVFRLPAPFLLDADEQRGEVTVSLTQRSEGEYALTYVPDAAFVQDASFPLVLDPAVESGTAETAIEDTYVKEGSTSNYGTASQIWITDNSTYGYREGFLRVNQLPKLGASHFITSAQLFVRTYTAVSSNADVRLFCREVTDENAWSASSITYATKPAYNETLYQDYCTFPQGKNSWQSLDVTNLAHKWYLGNNKGIALVPQGATPNTVRLCSSETSFSPYLVVDYASQAGLESYLTYDHQSAGLAGTGSVSLVNGNLIFAHADTSMNGNRMPVSITHYYNSCDADKNEFGLGMGWRTSLHQTLHKEYINEEVLYVYTDGDGTEHWFEPDEDTDAPDGQYKDMSGLSLTLNTEAITKDNVTTTCLVITDKGDNRMIFPNITAVPTSSAPATDKVLIQSIEDAVGNTVTVTPVSDYPLHIHSVEDGAGRVTSFTYNENLCTAIITPWQTADSCTAFRYDGNLLKDITHEDGRITHYRYCSVAHYTQDQIDQLEDTDAITPITTVHLLTEASSYTEAVATGGCDGSIIEYTYSNVEINSEGKYYSTDNLPHCITHAYVRGKVNKPVSQADSTSSAETETIDASDVSYTYGNHMTLVTDAISGKTLRYHFNDNGNQVSIDDELGYAVYTRYDQEGDNENTPINHATVRSRMQRVVKNLLVDPMIEQASSAWEKSSTGTIIRDQSTDQWGLVSYRIQVPANDSAYVRQAVEVVPGQSYTLSAYMKSGAPNAFLRVTYTVDGASQSVLSDPIPVVDNAADANFERIAVSFTLPDNAASSIYCEAVGVMETDSSGYFWFDAMQLEEGLTCNHFNLLQNVDFTQQSSGSTVPTSWTLGEGDASYISMVDLSEEDDDGTTAPEFLTGYAARLAGRYNRSIVLYQEFRHYGKKGDRFTAGGWCKSFAKKDNPDEYIHCHILVQFGGGDYWATGGEVVFNAEEGNWQFASASISAPSNYTYIRFKLHMNRQMNHADFTGLYLYPEAFGTEYVYDKKGNRKKTWQMYGGTHETEYDDYDNMIEYTQPGRSLATTYFYGDTEEEQKKHLLLKSISPLGTVSTATYDAHGNPLTAQVQDSKAGTGSFIHTETAYTPQDEQTQQHEGNYVISQTDARGKVVSTKTDGSKGTTTSVTDPKGQTVNYTYDNLRRIVKTSTAAGDKEYKNEYSYDASRGHLIEVRHNTDSDEAHDVVYTFEHDALGRQTSVKVGTQVLSTSEYNNTHGVNYGTLAQTTFGNGHKVRQQYDEFNRITGVIHGDETAPRYEYAYNAKGQVAHVRDNLLNRIAESEYDLANRPYRVKTHEGANHVYTGETTYNDDFGWLTEFRERVGTAYTPYATTFGYDEENRPTALTYKSGSTTVGGSGSTIDLLGRTTASTVTVGSQTYTSQYQFVAGGHGENSTTGLVASITQPGGDCAYTYDDNGNIATATVNGKLTTYTYDALGQLIRVDDQSDTTSGANGTTWKYTYDQGGNILKKERFAYGSTETALETVNYVYGDPNWRDKVTSIGGEAITYDAIGNPLNDGTWTYTWSNGRQLTRMQSIDTDASFVYNENGLRVQKTVNGVVTKYTLHGKNVVHMTSGSDELHFFYDAANKPAVVVYNGTAYAYVKNLQGDIIAILDQSGNAVVQYTYDAWGKPLSTTGSMASTLGAVQPFRYRGYVYDQETGLYYLRSRYYNLAWGRFLNADGLLSVSKSSLSSNAFAYCRNAPVILFDTNGTESEYMTQAAQYAAMLATLDMSTFNCYGYAMSYNFPPINLIPGGNANFAQNVDKSTSFLIWKTSQYDPAFFNSRNVMNLIISDLQERKVLYREISYDMLPKAMEVCDNSGFAIMAVRAGYTKLNNSGYVDSNNADFHIIIYADGFWSEKRGMGELHSYRNDSNFSPEDDSYWSPTLKNADTLYILYQKTHADYQ